MYLYYLATFGRTIMSSLLWLWRSSSVSVFQVTGRWLWLVITILCGRVSRHDKSTGTPPGFSIIQYRDTTTPTMRPTQLGAIRQHAEHVATDGHYEPVYTLHRSPYDKCAAALTPCWRWWWCPAVCGTYATLPCRRQTTAVIVFAGPPSRSKSCWTDVTDGDLLAESHQHKALEKRSLEVARPPLQHFPPITMNSDLWSKIQDEPSCQI